MIGIGCILISDLLEAFKDNRYQIWAQNSPFTTATPYKAWQQNPQQAYAALLNLLTAPALTLSAVKQDQADAYSYSYSLFAASLQNPEILLVQEINRCHLTNR